MSDLAGEEHSQSGQAAACGCFGEPYQSLVIDIELGMDRNYAEVSLFVCSVCGRHWLRYFYEHEAFTGSGRWHLGAISAEQAALLTAENAKAILEGLSWYFYGGSFYGGQGGKRSGTIFLFP